ncbi:YhaI family protein [Peribacillus aracenensis]|uniref:YhaI family protein n=1 Tax=Peribacillus aracenensis TaxID=2976708 RepID=UPI0021A4A1D0|nr:YhaI family protein [Peribacillus sp. BBB004]
MNNINEEIEILRFHQRLLLNLIRNPEAKLDYLFVEKNFTMKEAEELLETCDTLSKRYEIEKAEGYMNFRPLFNQFERNVNSKITIKECVDACLSQGLYVSFMREMDRV